MFQAHAGIELVNTLIVRLKADFSGTGLHYWAVPLLEAGGVL